MSSPPPQKCHATKQELLNDKKFDLCVNDLCPSCDKYGVQLEVSYHRDASEAVSSSTGTESDSKLSCVDLVKMARPSLSIDNCKVWVRQLRRPPYDKMMENAFTDQDFEEMRDVMETYERMIKSRTRASILSAMPKLRFTDNYLGVVGSKFYHCEFNGAPSLLKVLDAGGETRGYELVAAAGVHTFINSKNYLVEFQSLERSEANLEHRGNYAIMPLYPSNYGICPLTSTVAPRMIAQMLTALHTLHNCQLAHMDVKPANVFRNMQGDSFLGDFGSVTTFGFTASSTTDAFVPTDFERSQYEASEFHDWWMLGVTIVDKYFNLNIGTGPHSRDPSSLQVVRLLVQLRGDLVQEGLDIDSIDELLTLLRSDSRINIGDLQLFSSTSQRTAASIPIGNAASKSTASPLIQLRLRQSPLKLAYEHKQSAAQMQSDLTSHALNFTSPMHRTATSMPHVPPSPLSHLLQQTFNEKMMSATPTGSSIIAHQASRGR